MKCQLCQLCQMGSDTLAVSVCHIPLGYDTDTGRRIDTPKAAGGCDTLSARPTPRRAAP